jgi:hypothetical protein
MIHGKLRNVVIKKSFLCALEETRKNLQALFIIRMSLIPQTSGLYCVVGAHSYDFYAQIDG